MIYFVQPEGRDFVKVGYANPSVKRRVHAVQCGSPEPLIVIGEIVGDRLFEALLHQAMYKWRHRSEWFRLDPDCLVFVRAVLSSDDPEAFARSSLSPKELPTREDFRTSQVAMFAAISMTTKEIATRASLGVSTVAGWRRGAAMPAWALGALCKAGIPENIVSIALKPAGKHVRADKAALRSRARRMTPKCRKAAA